MSVKPNERIEFFLAKIAGEDIDTNTLTPPGAINATERALDGISERLNDIGPEYTAADAGKVLAVNESGTGTEWAEGGSDLPEYSESDAGKALTVNASGNGLEWAAGGSGSGVLLCNVIYGQYTTLDKTASEIANALSSGSIVFARSPYVGEDPIPSTVTIYYFYPLVHAIFGTYEEQATYEFSFGDELGDFEATSPDALPGKYT